MINYTEFKAIEKGVNKLKTSDKLIELNNKMGESYKILKSPRFITGLSMNFMYFVVLIFFNICTANFNFNAILTLGF